MSLKFIKGDSEYTLADMASNLNRSLKEQDWFVCEERVCNPRPLAKITNSSL